ncbi:reverse transcriptase [Corchorus capsularis]|uniref:Reverse transcriptase n=1 Tax=Corchorus capsularis TaxID=210143 RepID=A0A1R3G210_COCAP|nr:reverse transcriptase [Corchorus capsularis]
MVLLQEAIAPEEGPDDHLLEDLDILELSTEDEVNTKIKKHSLVGKTITERTIKIGPLRAILSKAWPLHDAMEIHELERNIFLFVFKSESDKVRVTQQSPWSVMENHLMLKDWSEDAVLEEIDFTLSEFWVQVHNLPLSYMTRANAEKIAAMFPGMVELDFDSDEDVRWNGVLRMKVRLNVEDPLKTGFYLQRKDKPPLWVAFKYERIPYFCYHCGRLGHVAKDCIYRNDGRKKGSYGQWMKATQLKYKTVTKGGPSSNQSSWKNNEGGREAARPSYADKERVQDVAPTKELTPAISDTTFNVKHASAVPTAQGSSSLKEHLMLPGPSSGSIEAGNELGSLEKMEGKLIGPTEKTISSPNQPMEVSLVSTLGKRTRDVNMDQAGDFNLNQGKRLKSELKAQISNWVYEYYTGMWDVLQVGLAVDYDLLSELFGHKEGETKSNIIESWEKSAKGLGQPSAIRALKGLIHAHRPSIVFLSETKQRRSKLESLRNRLGFAGSHYVDRRGRSGGLALWWNSDFNLEVIADSRNFIDVGTDLGEQGSWFCTFIYGDPRREGRRAVWEQISRLRGNSEERWCCLGGFNAVGSQSEKSGGHPIDRTQAEIFTNFLQDCNLMEIEIHGANFSWSNNREGEDNILEKLDKAYATVDWSNLFTGAIGWYEADVASDHCPLLITLEKLKKNRRRDFKFESKWLLDQEFAEVIDDGWRTSEMGSRMFRLSRKLANTRNKLRSWSKDKFQNPKVEVELRLKRIKEIQMLPLTKELKEELAILKREVDELWQMEERFWHQRSRLNWINYGDRNTHFFHSTTVQRRRRNSITRIMNNDGVWLTEEEEIRNFILNSYKELFRAGELEDVEEVLDSVERVITPEMNEALSKQVSRDEIEEAVFSLGALKAPGRLIQDNIIISHEAFHALNNRRTGRRGFMALKLDLSKAYDRVNWSFLKLLLDKMGFCEFWTTRVMECITSTQFSIVLNGERGDSFTPERGLRQGDPLSPYLFILITEVLSQLITKVIASGDWQGFRINRRCPLLSHLLFADDCLLFSVADERNCDTILNVLTKFRNATGQVINFTKSAVFFSSNTSSECRRLIRDQLGVQDLQMDNKYLGLPTMWGRGKKAALSFIADRIKSKIQGWKSKLLSMAGREVPDLPSFRITSTPSQIGDPMVVKDLINFDRKCWKDNLLRMVFNQTEVNAVKKIPIGSESTPDRLIWHFTRDGNYSVKSRYRLLTSEAISFGNNGQSSSSMQQSRTWRNLWNLKVAPKVKNFLWRSCRNIVPTKENLVKRHCSLFSQCDRCGAEVESLEHILFFCPFAQAVWRASHFSYSPRSEGFVSFLKWWEESANTIVSFGSLNVVELIRYLCWNVWKARNSFVFEGREGNPIEVWNHAVAEFVEYNESLLNANRIHGMGPTQQVWQPPQRDFIKLNCDAAFDMASGDAGIAVVCRDHDGSLIDGASFFTKAGSIDAAEAMALRLAVQLARDREWRNVIFESDNKGLIRRLNCHNQRDRWNTLTIELDTINMAIYFDSFSFSFVPRNCNRAADWVARKTKKRCCPIDWMYSPPTDLVVFLNS